MVTIARCVVAACLLLVAVVTARTLTPAGALIHAQDTNAEQRLQRLEQRVTQLEESLQRFQGAQEAQAGRVEERFRGVTTTMTQSQDDLRSMQRRQHEDGRMIGENRKAILDIRAIMKKCCG